MKVSEGETTFMHAKRERERLEALGGIESLRAWKRPRGICQGVLLCFFSWFLLVVV